MNTLKIIAMTIIMTGNFVYSSDEMTKRCNEKNAATLSLDEAQNRLVVSFASSCLQLSKEIDDAALLIKADTNDMNFFSNQKQQADKIQKNAEVMNEVAKLIQANQMIINSRRFN